MSQRPAESLTVEEWKCFVLARIEADVSMSARLNQCLHQALGIPTEQEPPETVPLQIQINEQVADLLARRLCRNDRAVPLFSKDDFAEVIPSILDAFARMQEDELTQENREALELMLQSVFSNMLEATLDENGTNLYDKYGQEVRATLDVASERGLALLDLMQDEGVNDAITRRTVPEGEFVARYQKRVAKFANADIIKDLFMPMLEEEVQASGGSEEEKADFRAYLQDALETELMPQLRELMDRAKPVADAFIAEEAERIYGTT